MLRLSKRALPLRLLSCTRTRIFCGKGALRDMPGNLSAGTSRLECGASCNAPECDSSGRRLAVVGFRSLRLGCALTPRRCSDSTLSRGIRADTNLSLFRAFCADRGEHFARGRSASLDRRDARSLHAAGSNSNACGPTDSCKELNQSLCSRAHCEVWLARFILPLRGFASNLWALAWAFQAERY